MFFWASKIFYGQVHYGNLLVPGQVENFNISTPLFSRYEISTLESEKQELLKELRLAESRSNQIMDEGHTDTLSTLVEANGINP